MLGTMAANQAGWSGAEVLVLRNNARFIADLYFTVGAAVSYSAFALVQRIAKPVLWVMVPMYLYFGLVMGAWNGFASDFDAIRGEALRHHIANAYALSHMSERGLFLSCQDDRIELTDDAKAACARALNPPPGERIPGSEHSCGFLRMFTCFNTTPEKPQRP